MTNVGELYRNRNSLFTLSHVKSIALHLSKRQYTVHIRLYTV